MYYPANYVNNQDCEWEIHASIGYYVVVTFEYFQLEKARYCSEYLHSADYVQLSENKRHIATLCLTDGLNKIYRSYASNMLIKFHTDSSVSFKGFNASYKQGVFKLYLELLMLCYVYYSL